MLAKDLITSIKSFIRRFTFIINKETRYIITVLCQLSRNQNIQCSKSYVITLYIKTVGLFL